MKTLASEMIRRLTAPSRATISCFWFSGNPLDRTCRVGGAQARRAAGDPLQWREKYVGDDGFRRSLFVLNISGSLQAR
jgi:hypothetical protein